MYPPQPPPNPIRPVRGLAAFAVAMLAGNSVVGLGVAAVDLWFAARVDAFIADPESIVESELTTIDAVYGLSGMAEFGVYIVTIIAFLVWLFRVRANAEAITPVPHRRSQVWLVFGWVVPIISLWFPKQIVDDIWNASKPGVLQSSFEHARRSGLIWFWWVAWLCAGGVSNVAARLLFRAEDPETMAAAARFDVFAIGLYLVAAALAIPLVLKITAFQEARRTEASVAWSPQP